MGEGIVFGLALQSSFQTIYYPLGTAFILIMAYMGVKIVTNKNRRKRYALWTAGIVTLFLLVAFFVAPHIVYALAQWKMPHH